MKQNTPKALAVVLLVAALLLASCSKPAAETSAANANVPGAELPPVPTELQQGTQSQNTQEIIQKDAKARVIPEGVKYYYIHLTEKGADPPTIVGYVGKSVLVDVINDMNENVHFVSPDAKVDKVLAENEEFSFEFTPATETAYYITYTTNKIEDSLGRTSDTEVGRTGEDVDEDEKPTDGRIRVVTLEQ